MKKVHYKRNYWLPGTCKEDVEFVFLTGQLYRCLHRENDGYYLYDEQNRQYFFHTRPDLKRPYPYFMDYFCTIKDLRKSKLLEISKNVPKNA